MEKKKILIVEDDKDYRWILEQGFASVVELNVLFAKDGEEGLAMVEKESPELVILDIMMPKMDGMEVARQIKEKGLKPKIVFLTNLSDLKYIMGAVEVVKETDYIIKSDIRVPEIVERVKARLDIK